MDLGVHLQPVARLVSRGPEIVNVSPRVSDGGRVQGYSVKADLLLDVCKVGLAPRGRVVRLGSPPS